MAWLIKIVTDDTVLVSLHLKAFGNVSEKTGINLDGDTESVNHWVVWYRIIIPIAS